MHVYYVGLKAVERPLAPGACLVQGDAAWWSFLGACGGFAICTGYIVLNFVGFGARWSQHRFLAWYLTPALLGAIALTFFWSAYPCEINLGEAVVVAAVIPALGWIALGGLARLVLRQQADDGATLRIRVGLRTIAAALAGGPVIGGGIWYLCTFDYGFGPGDHMAALYAVFGVPSALALWRCVQMMVFVGIAQQRTGRRRARVVEPLRRVAGDRRQRLDSGRHPRLLHGRPRREGRRRHGPRDVARAHVGVGDGRGGSCRSSAHSRASPRARRERGTAVGRSG